MRIAIVFLVILAIGCKANKVTACENFDAFFEQFARDSIFQKKHVDFPMMNYYSDEDFPLDLMERPIDEEEYIFTDFTDDKNLYDITIDRKKDTVHYIRTWRESYGAMTYTFARKNNCWMLVGFQDITD
jgi:hypothetical protein